MRDGVLIPEKKYTFFRDDGTTLTAEWDGNNWVFEDSLITEGTIWGVDFRTRGLGVDAGDQWILSTGASGDSFVMQQWDDSAAAFIKRLEIIGKGTAVTNEGDLIFYDQDGVETGRWDESAGEWTFTGLAAAGITERLEVSEEGVLVTDVGSMRWYPPYNITLLDVATFVGTAPTGATIEVDVNKNGTTVFTTQTKRPIIATSGFHDVSDTPDVTALTGDTDYLTFDIDQVGSTVAGADLVIQVRFNRT
jgi:hypothetical protein